MRAISDSCSPEESGTIGSGPRPGGPGEKRRPMETIRRVLIGVGLVLVLVGVFWPLLSRLGLGRLPGDIVIRRDNFSFYFPLATCLLVSGLLTLIFWFFRKF